MLIPCGMVSRSSIRDVHANKDRVSTPSQHRTPIQHQTPKSLFLASTLLKGGWYFLRLQIGLHRRKQSWQNFGNFEVVTLGKIFDFGRKITRLCWPLVFVFRVVFLVLKSNLFLFNRPKWCWFSAAIVRLQRNNFRCKKTKHFRIKQKNSSFLSPTLKDAN